MRKPPVKVDEHSKDMIVVAYVASRMAAIAYQALRYERRLRERGVSVDSDMRRFLLRHLRRDLAPLTAALTATKRARK
jgi:hypothetical protein